MMRLIWIICVLLVSRIVAAQTDNVPPGMWREHLPYGSAIAVTQMNDLVIAATPFSLYSVDPGTGAIQRFSKITGLSETGISAIHFNSFSNELMVVYSNSNIDVLNQGSIRNIPELMRDDIAGDKTVYDIFSFQNYWYLSTGIGIVVIDGELNEIDDSWFIGSGGNRIRVNGFTIHDDSFFAATEEGLKTIAAAGTNPSDHQQWQALSGANGLPAGEAKDVFSFEQSLLALVNDSIFTWDGNSWNLFYGDDWPLIAADVSGSSILLSQRKRNGDSRVIEIDGDGSLLQTITQPGFISFPQQAMKFGGAIWVADLFGGLTSFSGAEFRNFDPDSPEGLASGELIAHDGVFIATAGEVNSAWNYQYNPNGIYRLKDGDWQNFNRFNFPQLDSLLDFVTVTLDKRDGTIWAGSFGGGLARIAPDGNINIFKQNSPLQPAIGDPGSYRVSGLAMDASYNLWIANYGTIPGLHVLKDDGNWQSFNIPFSLFDYAVSQIIVDMNDQKWIVSPKGNGLIVFNHGNTIEDNSDDRWRLLQSGAGRGNLPSSDVYSIAEDKSGFIWIGTSNGVAVVQCAPDVTHVSCDAVWPVVDMNGFSDYLFRGETVRSIAVDGADRKWMATRNGAWLLDARGEKVIAHFTEANSPLLSNDVQRISIDGSTGEVFFATAKGLVSYRAYATEGKPVNENLLVYPNPVPPGYTGMIAIKGVAANAIVKITEPDGRLVYQTRALGGQAVWDGRDYRGNRVSSGVYLVLVSDDGRTENASAKIVFIHSQTP